MSDKDAQATCQVISWNQELKLQIVEFLITEHDEISPASARNDIRGPSKYGITQQMYNEMCRQQPNQLELKAINNLNKQDAIQYHLTFMDQEIKIERFSNYKVACVIFDIYICHTPIVRGQLLMQAAGLERDYPGDNLVGAKIVKAIQDMDPEVFYEKVLELREAFLLDQAQENPKSKEYICVQLNRMTRIKNLLKDMNNTIIVSKTEWDPENDKQKHMEKPLPWVPGKSEKKDITTNYVSLGSYYRGLCEIKNAK